jgi:hypothetical protein
MIRAGVIIAVHELSPSVQLSWSMDLVFAVEGVNGSEKISYPASLPRRILAPLDLHLSKFDVHISRCQY